MRVNVLSLPWECQPTSGPFGPDLRGQGVESGEGNGEVREGALADAADSAKPDNGCELPRSLDPFKPEETFEHENRSYIWSDQMADLVSECMPRPPQPYKKTPNGQPSRSQQLDPYVS